MIRAHKRALEGRYLEGLEILVNLLFYVLEIGREGGGGAWEAAKANNHRSFSICVWAALGQKNNMIWLS